MRMKRTLEDFLLNEANQNYGCYAEIYEDPGDFPLLTIYLDIRQEFIGKIDKSLLQRKIRQATFTADQYFTQSIYIIELE